jgi:hypothetical protein
VDEDRSSGRGGPDPYGVARVIMGILSTVVRLHLSRSGLLDPDPGAAQLRASILGGLGSVAVFAVSILIALWNPTAAEYFWLVLIPLRFGLSRLPAQR